MAQHAELDGADAVSLVPPYYYKFSKAEVISYYRNSAFCDLNTGHHLHPQFTAVELDTEIAGALLTDEQVLGVKHTPHNLYSLELMVAQYPEKVFSTVLMKSICRRYLPVPPPLLALRLIYSPERFIAVRDALRLGDLS